MRGKYKRKILYNNSMRSRMQHVVFIANILFSFSLAITTFTNSSYIEKSIDTKGVGIIYVVSALLSIVLLSRGARDLARYGNRRYFLGIGAVHALSLLALALPFSILIHAAGLIAYLISGYALIFSFDIFFEHTALVRGRGRTRGLYLALGSCGWVIGPLITARIIDTLGYGGIYALALVIFALIAVIMAIGLKRYQDPKYTSHRAHMMLAHLWKVPTLRTVILANFILQFFYAWMVVYTPIYLHEYIGLSWDTIGIIFAVMLTTFVVLDYPLGRIADRLGSEKELSAIGFLIMACSVFGFVFLSSTTAITFGILLFVSRIGAATVEAMTEIHFFKIIDGANPMYLSIFRDLRPLAYVTAPIVAIIAFAFLPFKLTFAVLGIILLIGFFAAFKMERKSDWWVREHRD